MSKLQSSPGIIRTVLVAIVSVSCVFVAGKTSARVGSSPLLSLAAYLGGEVRVAEHDAGRAELSGRQPFGPTPSLVINEIDYDNVGNDTAEFIEIKNVSGASINLDPVVVELINGASCCVPYQSFDLPNVNLAADGYFTICGDGATVLNCDLQVTPGTNIIQNGAPDAVGLRISGNLVDAVSYEGDTAAPYTEGSGAGLADDNVTPFIGISRFPDGVDTNVNNVDLSVRCITPGSANTSVAAGCAAVSPTPTPTDTPTATATSTFTPTPTPITISGSYNVGSGQTYASLTMPGGIFEAINTYPVVGDVTINITSDLAGEDGVVALNEFASGFTVLIKPSGATRTITGASAVGIIRLNAADNVTIDGSTTGGTVTGVVGGDPALRELTIENSDPSTSSSVIILDTGSNGSQNNTLKNLNIRGSSPDQTGYLISVGGATGGSAGNSNNFNTIENCSLRRSTVGIWMSGSTSPSNLGNLIAENDVTGSGVDRIRKAAISVGSQNGMEIRFNSIGGIDSSAAEDALAIGVGVLSFTNSVGSAPNCTNTQVYRNKINGVQQTNGRSAGGIVLLCSGCQVYNNMVTGVISNASGTRLVAGIYAAGGTTALIADNSVSMIGDRGILASQSPSFALALGSGTIMSVYDNILYTTQTSGGGVNANSYALGVQLGGLSGSMLLNNNDFWSAGTNDGGFRLGSLAAGSGIDYPTLAAWQTATSRDLNSIEADPLFVNVASDLHIQHISPARNLGGGASGIGDDFDGDARPQEGSFDMGADELLPVSPTPTSTPTDTPTPANTPSISGTVTYGNAAAPPKYISNVTVNAAGSPSLTAFTGVPGPTAGQYVLTGFGSGSYTVSLAKTTGQNGIGSNDAARIAQHVSGAVLFTNDRQKVAADVSGNGVISSNDAAFIARFVAGLGAPFGNTGQWRFYVSPGPTFPVGASPTTRTYSSVTGNLAGEDYIGLLIGETTGNWSPSAARPVEKRRETGDLRQDTRGNSGPERGVAVELPEVTAEVGKEIVVPVKVEGVADKSVISYEFDLRYDPLVMQPVGDGVDLKDTASRGLSVVTNANVPGLLRVVVYGAFPIGEDGVLLNLRFTAVGAAGSVSPISFERIMFNEGEPRVSVVDGRVELF